MIRAFVLWLVVILPGVAFAGDPVVDFNANDPIKDAAVALARKTLPKFLRNTLHGHEQSIDGASLKVEVAIHADLSEIIWVLPFARARGGGFVGVLANEPVHMSGYSAGDTIRFARRDIQDWSLMRDDQLYGNYVTRIMLPHLDAENRAWLNDALVTPPVPLDW
ncbi:MAG: DUF2314 domain-containing protein [Roseovarius sp.]|nr:DUF2314 domain-containing protein [Roseovarius sp.]